MDTAGTGPADSSGVPAAGSELATLEPALIGVPIISPVDRARRPVAVPSVPVPEAVAVEPARLAPVVSATSTPPAGPATTAPPGTAVAPVLQFGRAAPVETDRHGFPPGVAERLGSYVYLLVDPRTGRPFYVGRGRGDRCYRHVAEARSAVTGTGAAGDGEHDGPTAFPVLDQIRAAESTGRQVRVDILRYGLKGSEASLVAGAARDALGLRGDDGLPDQRRPAPDLVAQLARRAKFKHSHRVVLLRVGPTGSDPSYDTARHGWPVGRRWTDPGSARSPVWAVVVVGVLVAGVYRIERWEPSPETGLAPAGRSGVRYSFVGAADPELDARYRGRSVARYAGERAPNQVTYVWCGPHWVNSPR
jgi:uncharacterized protein